MIYGKTWATALTLMKRKLQLWILHLLFTAITFHLNSSQSRNTHNLHLNTHTQEQRRQTALPTLTKLQGQTACILLQSILSKTWHPIPNALW